MVKYYPNEFLLVRVFCWIPNYNYINNRYGCIDSKYYIFVMQLRVFLFDVPAFFILIRLFWKRGGGMENLDSFAQFFNAKAVDYFDYAATTFMPERVINKWVDYQSNVGIYYGKGNNDLADRAYKTLMESERILFDHFGVSGEYGLIYGKNVTEIVNIIAISLREHIRPMDIILVGPYEHHSNILPWKYLAKSTGALFIEMPLTIDDEIDWNYLEKISKNIKLVAVSSTSNTNGYKVDIKRICDIFTDSLIFVDESQTEAHSPIYCDNRITAHFLSSHKMYGPKNIAGAFVRRDFIDSIEPVLLGGGMVETVALEDTWKKSEKKFEAGTTDIGLISAWAEACLFVREVGFDTISKIDEYCFSKIYETLSNIPGVRIVSKVDQCKSLISFVSDKKHAHDIEHMLANSNIIIRSGNMCAQPSIRKMNEFAINRLSYGIGVTKASLERLCEKLKEV